VAKRMMGAVIPRPQNPRASSICKREKHRTTKRARAGREPPRTKDLERRGGRRPCRLREQQLLVYQRREEILPTLSQKSHAPPRIGEEGGLGRIANFSKPGKRGGGQGRQRSMHDHRKGRVGTAKDERDSSSVPRVSGHRCSTKRGGGGDKSYRERGQNPLQRPKNL